MRNGYCMCCLKHKHMFEYNLGCTLEALGSAVCYNMLWGNNMFLLQKIIIKQHLYLFQRLTKVKQIHFEEWKS